VHARPGGTLPSPCNSPRFYCLPLSSVPPLAVPRYAAVRHDVSLPHRVHNDIGPSKLSWLLEHGAFG
jgi:hypothetical protein